MIFGLHVFCFFMTKLMFFLFFMHLFLFCLSPAETNYSKLIKNALELLKSSKVKFPSIEISSAVLFPFLSKKNEIMNFSFCNYNVFSSYRRFYEFQFKLWKIWSVLWKSAESNVQSKTICNQFIFFNNMLPFVIVHSLFFWLIVIGNFVILRFFKITVLLYLWLPKRNFSVLHDYCNLWFWHARSKSAFLFMKLWLFVFHGNAHVCSFFHRILHVFQKKHVVKEKMLHFFSHKKTCKNHV